MLDNDILRMTPEQAQREVHRLKPHVTEELEVLLHQQEILTAMIEKLTRRQAMLMARAIGCTDISFRKK